LPHCITMLNDHFRWFNLHVWLRPRVGFIYQWPMLYWLYTVGQ
jgi:hypothetical protein